MRQQDSRHPFQSSCDHFVPGLRSQPWWDSSEFPFVSKVEACYSQILAEFDDLVLSGRLKLHPQSRGGPRKQIANGDWNIFELWSMGYINERNAFDVPKTVALLSNIEELISHPKGLVYFSVLHPGVHVTKHCGPTNTRIRIHLGLKVPDGACMRVGNETRSWIEGKCLIFDDSWEHEVHNVSEHCRAVLLMDAWHPDLSEEQRQDLMRDRRKPDEFKHRQREGWIRLVH